ncbi:Putative P-loop containing nucleoside triphosphate hydrolase [Septoria linicola]|uniref:P-loop containing nucleoside triphosphate hydrolase n=1 Tax=Septoria linicola TaxID=215465 RepID=A0A9Q9EI04_9PEZI|nr:Putative P-loop containing nucleoside triphosphate hydrolase [Septoria linicola]
MPKGRRARGKKPHRPANSPRHEDSAAASAAPHEDQAMGLPPRYWGIFWVDFSSVESANAGEPIRQVVYQLKIEKRPWLLVMDNCDKLEINYATYLPRNDTGAIIITTRLQAETGSRYAASFTTEIHGLVEQSAIQLLTGDLKVAKDMTSPRYSAAKAITDQLDCHSLTVTVAASFLSKSIYTIEEYTAKLEKTSTQKELWFERLTENEPRHRTVFTTFEVSINELAIKDCIVDQCALELLSVLAFLDRSAVTEGLFSGAWSWGQKHQNDADEVNLQSER